MNNQDYFFMSVGEKTCFYTLNYAWFENIYKSNDYGHIIIDRVERRTQFLRNLSQDFDTAIEKAKDWHKNHKGKITLKLLSSPITMNDIQRKIRQEYQEKVASGIILSGKFSGKHVSDLEENYMHWVLENIFNPDLLDGEQNLLAQIIYNYAEENGIIEKWRLMAFENLKKTHNAEVLNSKIDTGVLLAGQFKGLSFEEAFTTQKGDIKKRSVNYLNWMLNSVNLEKDLKVSITDRENICYIEITPELLINDFILSVIIINNKIAEITNKKRGFNIKDIYRFESNSLISDKDLLSWNTIFKHSNPNQN